MTADDKAHTAAFRIVEEVADGASEVVAGGIDEFVVVVVVVSGVGIVEDGIAAPVAEAATAGIVVP